MVESLSSRRWPVKAALFALAVASALVVMRLYPPSQHSFYPKCFLYQWTGLHCAGCGGTRAVAALAQGQFLEAFRMNPLLIAGTPVIALLIYYQQRQERRFRRIIPSISWVIAGVVIFYTIARNIPSPTSSPLAPPVSEPVKTAMPDPTPIKFGSTVVHKPKADHALITR